MVLVRNILLVEVVEVEVRALMQLKVYLVMAALDIHG